MRWYAWLLSGFLIVLGCDSSFEETVRESGKIALGKKLFFESRLSLNGQTSCASCHRPAYGFAEPITSRSIGFQLSRNTPGLWAIGKRNHLHWDGGVPDLESQALGPLQSMEELGLNLKIGVARLREDEFYQKAFQKVFGASPDVSSLVQALAAFQRSLDPLNFLDTQRIKPYKSHMDLFLKVGCGRCHVPPYFFRDAFVRLSVEKHDQGRARITGWDRDQGSFRIPSLWAVGLTAPYFHDGRFLTLKDAILGHDTTVPNLSAGEMDSLIYFLHQLQPDIP
jgi:cytochrome c peroxidase